MAKAEGKQLGGAIPVPAAALARRRVAVPAGRRRVMAAPMPVMKKGGRSKKGKE